MFTLTIGILLLSVICTNAAQRKPAKEYLHICSDPKPEVLDECIKNSLEELKPLLIKGAPELGLPSIRPLQIERIEMHEGQGNFKLKQILTNLKVYGLSDYEVKEIRSNFKELTFNTTLFTKKADFIGNYEMDGQVLVLPVKGNGKVNHNFTDVTIKFITNLEKYQKNGEDYVRVKKVKMSINPKGAVVHFTNLFNGDKTLGDATNKFLNSNWKEAFETFRHLPENAFGEFIKSLSNRFFENFPMKELFPFGL
uniref:Putative hemolymph juvenile hormone binding protein n=1 Tax=Panstrongylus lignarius TaxID=156445 RepID=A0A224XV41_9HEMI